MSRLWRIPAGPLTSILLLCSAAAHAAGTPATSARSVTLVDVQVKAGGAAEVLTFLASGEMEYALHQEAGPPRLIIDFPAVRSSLRDRPLPAGLRLVSGLRIGEFGRGRQRLTRAEIGLRQPAQVDVIRSPGVLTIVLKPTPLLGLAEYIEEPPGTEPAGPESSSPDEVVPLYLLAPAGPEPGAAEPSAIQAGSQTPAAPGPTVPPPPGGADRLEAPAAVPLAGGTAEVPLGPLDLLQVKVFGVESLDRKVRVSSDGTISLPLVGALAVSGLTQATLEREIARRLADGFVKDPQVSVFIEEYRSRRVSVSGAVRQPGAFDILRPTTLLEVLALAGGVLPEEAAARVQIQRLDPPGGVKTIEVDRLALQRGKLEQNLDLEPGDLIHVPFEEMLEVRVQGKVAHPDRYRARRGDSLTVLQAVLRAGGLASGASGKRVEVVRRGGEARAGSIFVNLNRIREGKDPDLPLEPDDIVVVY